MITIRGVYDGKNIRPLESITAKPDARVIITFLDEEAGGPPSQSDKTAELVELCSSWRDERSPEDIVRDIYESRTATQRGLGL